MMRMNFNDNDGYLKSNSEVISTMSVTLAKNVVRRRVKVTFKVNITRAWIL